MITTSPAIKVAVTVDAPIQEVWKLWMLPEHITKWNEPSSEWHTPQAQNDLRVGGRFVYRMEAKDGSLGFDFAGVYDKIKTNELIEYTLDDGRKVKVAFTQKGVSTFLMETFEAEQTHPAEMQQAGWQSILESFKNYAEKVIG